MTTPNQFLCPITCEVMRDPVVGSDGQTYERAAIVEWLRQHRVSPMTRAPMSERDLVPNYALKSMIEESLGGPPEVLTSESIADAIARMRSARQQQATAHVAMPQTAIDLDVRHQIKDSMLHVQVRPPQRGPKCPSSIICILDISGSMDEQASIPNADGESDGFSRLDLVKHSVNTVIHTLEDADELAILTFSDSARVEEPLTKTNEQGKVRLLQRVSSLQTEGSTNLWDGLRVGVDLSAGRPCTLLVFTDGLPNIDPPRGIVPTLKTHMSEREFKGTIHVFGFGYSLNSKLLSSVSVEGGGLFGYIPDPSMVGTIFVNFVSNVLSTYARGLKLYVPSSSAEAIIMSTAYYGQTRDIMIPICSIEELKEGRSVDARIEGSGISHSFTIDPTCSPMFSETDFVLQSARNAFITGLRRAHAAASPDAKEILENLIQELRSLQPQHLVQHFLLDLDSPSESEGQVTKAINNRNWYNKWGQHYVLSLVRAHQLQMCLNFRDPSVQKYGGPVFDEYRNKADKLFCSLPPPTPSCRNRYSGGSISSGPVSMSAYYNASGPCFDGDALVAMAEVDDNGRHILKKVRDLEKGDVLSTGGRVRCLIETILNRPTKVININGMWITPWHPIRRNGEWIFPNDVNPWAVMDRQMPSIFNLVLDSAHFAVICDVETITLGHDFTGPVAGHPYFGSQRVIDDLSQLDGWDRGLLVLEPDCVVRAPDQLLATGIIGRKVPTTA